MTSPVNPNFYISEQASPYFSKLIGAMLNRPTVVLTADYPTSHPGLHDEPFVVGKDGSLIGFWYKLNNFIDDYDRTKNPMALDEYWLTHKPDIYVNVISGGKPKKFEYEDLAKVLND